MESNKSFGLNKNKQAKPDQEKIHAGEFVIVTDRGFLTYIHELKLSYSELQNKNVLDVGSGLRERFSRQAKDQLNAKVFSVNPKLKGWLSRKILKFKNPNWQKRSVAAGAEQLPFTDNYFDTATSLWAISEYLNEKQKLRALKEIMRVLKPGGKLHMSPKSGDFTEGDVNEFDLDKETLDWLRENGHTIDSGYGDDPVIIIKNPNNENTINKSGEVGS